MLLGRLTMLELGAQIIGIVVMIVLALILQSVWALVIGGLVGSSPRRSCPMWCCRGPGRAWL
jgi:hypothetical protein